MMEAARRFARRVLLIHLVIFLVAVLIVVVAAREVYAGAREEAIGQAKQRQELIARQTARGIEEHYKGILANLDLWRRSGDELGTDETEPAEVPSLNAAAGRPVKPVGGAGPVARVRPFSGLNAQLIHRQLQGRASVVFMYDRGRGRLTTVLPEEARTEVAGYIKSEGIEGWLKDLGQGEISPYIAGGAHPGHIVAVPAPGSELVLAAYVPLEWIKSRFFDSLNAEGTVGAALANERGAGMVTTDARTVGLSAGTAIQDPALAASIQRFVTSGEAGSLVVPVAMTIGPVVVPPRILAMEPVKGVPGGRWAVIIMSPLAETDAVVSGLFLRAMWWAVFVVVLMTGILMSTSVTMIRGRVKLERMRHDILTRELNQAREIQLAWLPDATQPPAGLLVAAVNLPASHISGDFYDWFTLEDGRVVMTIGDVAGHGMSAAFLMATTQLLVRNTMRRMSDPGLCLGEVNRQLCTQAFGGQFVTIALLVLDTEEGTIEMSAAGHAAPLVRSHEGFRALEIEPELVLGVDPGMVYATHAYVLHPDSMLLLYTDGVVEAENAQGEQFAGQRLVQALDGAAGEPREIVAAVVRAVKTFCGNAELADDLTLVAIQLQGQPAGVGAG